MTLWGKALDLLFPPRCPFCQEILEQPRDVLCPACQPKLPWLTGRAAERKVDFSAGCLSPLRYRESVRDAIHRYKFSGKRGYGQPFGILMAQCAQDHWSEVPELVTWVPLSAKRLRKRGYDQSEQLARKVGEVLNLPVQPTLVKVRHTDPQSHLEEESARRANALGAYSLYPDGDVAGKRLLLVDDVVTSGATLSECARVLLGGGAKEIYCLTLAQAKSDE